MRNTAFWWILLSVMLLTDLYFFQAVRSITHSGSIKTRHIIFIVYWSLSVIAILTLAFLPYLPFAHQNKLLRSTIFAIIAGLFFAKLVACIFFLFDDARRLIQWVLTKIFHRGKFPADHSSDDIPRSVFLSWVGTLAGAGIFGSLLYGFRNKYRYQVRRLSLAFTNLPASFRGMKILHISDIHSGSFTDKQAVKKGVDKILAENADLVLFTGDLVNNAADEMKDYMDTFSIIKAPMGVYSTLGNHDYGDYIHWNSPAEKKANLEKLKGIHQQLGWRLLMNEHIILSKNNEQIAVIGIENWSAKKRFTRYGDLSKAYKGAENIPFKILMSHDPSHWKAEVTKKYPAIDLMLAGHTHGMQFGVEIPGFKWSPVQYFYKEWAGLYEEGGQKLYVNRGFGFLGYPGRVGILPEITVIELV